MREKIIKLLERQGIFIGNPDHDINLLEYNLDSLTFISLVLDIEEEMGVILPDELFDVSVLSSLNGFVALIEVINNN